MNAKNYVALTIIGSLILTASVQNLSTASPIQEKKRQVEEVKKSIDQLNEKMEIAVEDYNQSLSSLGVVKQKLHKNKLKLSENKAELDLKKKTLSKRIISMYKEGPFSTLRILLMSKTFRDFLEGMYFVGRVIDSDNTLVENLVGSKKQLEQINNQLNQQKSQQEILVNKVASKKLEVQNAIYEKNRLMKSIQKDLARLQAEERARIKRIKEEALRKLRESQPPAPAPNYDGGNSAPSSNVVEIAKKYLGVRYTWGGTSPETGFDCSGFVWFVYQQVGVTLPRTSRQQYNYLSSQGRLVSESNLAPGDLVFYGRSGVTDVKMYMGAGYVIGANGGQFTPGEVRILTLHYRSDFYAAGRP